MITGKIIKILPKSLRSRIENNHELRRIIGNVNWLTFENLLRSLIGMVIFGWIARYLGPEQFGLMSYAIAFISIFAILSTLGLDDLVIKGIVSNPEKKENYLGTSLLLKFLGSILMIIFSVSAIFIVEKDSSLLKLFVFILSFGYIFKSLDVIDLWFKSQVQSRYSVYARSLSFIVISALKIILIIVEAPLVAFVIMYSLDLLLSSIFLIYFYVRKGVVPLFRWKVNREVLTELLKNCWPLVLVGLTLTAEAEMDQVLLKNILGAEKLGLYSAALKIVVSFSFISTILRSSFFPSIVSAKKNSEDLYKKKLEQFYQMMMITFLLIAIPLTVFSKEIVQILYGNEYLAIVPFLPFVSIRLFFTHYSTSRAIFLLNEDLLKYSFLTSFAGTIVNIVLNLYLIPKYQIAGVIISFVISFLVNIFIIDLIYPKTRGNAWVMIKSIFNFYKLLFK